MADKVQAAQATGQANQVSHVNQAAQAAQASQASQVQSVQATQKAQATSSAQKVDAKSHHVERAHAPDHATGIARAQEVAAPNAAVQAKAPGNGITGLLGDIEKGQGLMDKLIGGGLSGQQFSNSELLALQAGMFKYTQELELTGKVVEKATTGLKDTLKTQV